MSPEDAETILMRRNVVERALAQAASLKASLLWPRTVDLLVGPLLFRRLARR
jgi:hypothetical protein